MAKERLLMGARLICPGCSRTVGTYTKGNQTLIAAHNRRTSAGPPCGWSHRRIATLKDK